MRARFILERVDRSLVGAREPMELLTAVFRQLPDPDTVVHTIDGAFKVSSLLQASFEGWEPGRVYTLTLTPDA